MGIGDVMTIDRTFDPTVPSTQYPGNMIYHNKNDKKLMKNKKISIRRQKLPTVLLKSYITKRTMKHSPYNNGKTQ